MVGTGCLFIAILGVQQLDWSISLQWFVELVILVVGSRRWLQSVVVVWPVSNMFEVAGGAK